MLCCTIHVALTCGPSRQILLGFVATNSRPSPLHKVRLGWDSGEHIFRHGQQQQQTMVADLLSQLSKLLHQNAAVTILFPQVLRGSTHVAEYLAKARSIPRNLAARRSHAAFSENNVQFVQVGHPDCSMARSRKGNRYNDPVQEMKPNCETNILVTENLFVGKERP